MSAKKYLLSLFFISFGTIQPKFISHESSYSEVELINGIQFKYFIKSLNGKREESFFIDDIPTMKKDYIKVIDEAKLAEWHNERELTEKNEREKLDFKDQMNIILLKKLVNLLVEKVQTQLDLVNNELLKPYFGYAYNEKTIQSYRDLAEMKDFLKVELVELLPELIDCSDCDGLKEVIDKIEGWPDRLELFFKDSVKHAIEKSDDTAALKELLAFVS